VGESVEVLFDCAAPASDVASCPTITTFMETVPLTLDGREVELHALERQPLLVIQSARSEGVTCCDDDDSNHRWNHAV